MSLEVIYVTRHGFRSNWLVDPSTGDYTAQVRSPTGIPADPALTAHGLEQAKELAAHLMGAARPPVELVYSSPYFRCLQTVEPFVKLKLQQLQGDGVPLPPPTNQVGFALRAEAGLSEWYGSAPFDHPTSAPLGTLKALFPVLDETYPSVVAPPRSGESIAELHDRVARALEGIIEHCDRAGVRAVLLCSHAATIIAAGRVLTGSMPDDPEVDDFRAFTCGLSVYRRRTANKARGGGGKGSISSSTTTTTSEGLLPGVRLADLPSSSSTGDHEPQVVAQSNAEGRPVQGSPPRPTDRRPPPSKDQDPDQVPEWRGGRGVGGEPWVCEVNCDCSFLTSGEERGWRFSGDESFTSIDHDHDHGAAADAGMQLGVTMQGRGGSRL